MSEEAAPVTVARAFIDAWTSGDMDTTAGYVADDVVFDGPFGHVEGKTAYIESLKGLARNLAVTGVRVVAAFGDATQALIMYELLTDRFDVLTRAKLLSVRNGKILSDRLTFDSYPVRMS